MNKVKVVSLLARLGSVFAVSAIPNVAIGAVLDVSAWKSAVMAGAISVFAVVYAIAAEYKKDGDLTDEELDEILKVLEEADKKAEKKTPAKKTPAKKTAPAKKAPAKKPAR